MSGEPLKRQIIYRPAVEGIGGAAPMPLRGVVVSVLISTLACLVLGSKALLNWTNDLPISPVSDFLLYVAQSWHTAMIHLGVTGFSDSIQKALRHFEALR